ncbi:carboxypeptidase-like regulatory domain-containing protein [Dysgonomonas sp. OttesenSCG-928-D17]|nr:carboxypeptidase-like regulatory domain-containing protein [Dysgonomonas sp. OttesenSCG-928-D17]
MKRSLLTLLIITCTTTLYSQNKIQGTIIDNYDKRPVHGAVIIYGTGKTETTTSNTKGLFWIPETANQPIQIQCLGYEKTTILPLALKKHPVVELTLEPVSLAPVEINADAAKHLVEKAIYNTKNKMLTNKYLSYITHITESEHLSGEKRDFFFKYAAMQKKKQPNKKEIPFELRLIDIKHMDSLPDKPVSEILKVGIGRSEFHLHTLSNNFDYRYVTISYTEDNSLIKLESYPSRGSYSTIKNIYYINASDTTLRSVQAESMESRIAKSPYLNNKFMKYKYKLLRMNSAINFEKTDDQYYYASATYTYIYSFLMGDKEEIIISYLDNKLIDMKDEIGDHKKIDNNARKLYDIPTSIAK